VQGTSFPDIVIGAALEQSHSWASELPDEKMDAPEQALWDAFNS
jgi:hypothetical protein